MNEKNGKIWYWNRTLLKTVSCKGAKYNTYLIDMISFLYQIVNVKTEGSKYFEKKFRLPVVYREQDNPSEIYMNKVTDTSNAYDLWTKR